MPTLALRTVLLLVVLLVGGSAPAAAQRVVYVDADATGAGTGTSWADAYRELRTALAAVLAGDELWVARGTYKPSGATNREATFTLRSGVALYGGFAGTETAHDERDWTTNETVLSGDIGAPGDSTDNSYHVVTATDADSTAVLDGFTVTQGRSTGGATSHGAGMLIVRSSPRVRNCRFVRNRGPVGGGMSIDAESHPDIRDVLFENNRAGSGGGGIATLGGGQYMERVTFRGNVSSSGGAISNYLGGVPVCIDCTFEGNSGLIEGGGAIYNVFSGSVFVRARFIGNTGGSSGGAIYSQSDSTLVCIDCTFRDNRSLTGQGGAVAIYDPHATFVNAVFEGNRADRQGGAIAAVGTLSGAFPVALHNVTLAGNRSGLPGGALYADNVRFEAVGLTAAGNGSGDFGQRPGAVFFAENAPPSRFDNAVLWGNGTGGATVAAGSVPLVVRRAIVEGGCAPPMACDRVLDADPLFVRPPLTDSPTDGGDLRLLAGSPALDAGLAARLPPDVWDLDGDGDTAEPLPLDLSGGPRVLGGDVDLGAYEGGVPVASEPGAPAASLALTVAPNPARGAAVAALELTEAGDVRVEAFDVLGRRVAVLHDGPLAAGRHEVPWSLAGVAPGVYVVRVSVGAEGAAGPVAAARRLVVAGR